MVDEQIQRRHPYILLRNGVAEAYFSNFDLAMSTGWGRSRSGGKYTVRWGSEEHVCKKVVKHRDAGDELLRMIQ